MFSPCSYSQMRINYLYDLLRRLYLGKFYEIETGLIFNTESFTESL
jgi:hypothetical protein